MLQVFVSQAPFLTVTATSNVPLSPTETLSDAVDVEGVHAPLQQQLGEYHLHVLPGTEVENKQIKLQDPLSYPFDLQRGSHSLVWVAVHSESELHVPGSHDPTILQLSEDSQV